MRILSVNVGLPRRIQWRGRDIETGIFKEPVAGRVAVEPLNLRGDRQADLSVHGGADKAVYAYPHEHYAFWRRELELEELPPGSFGENLTVTGFAERDVRIGEHWRVGSCELAVTQPRVPCFKLAAKFRRPDMIRRFLASRRTGFYFRVLRPGELGPGDAVELRERDESAVSIADVVELFAAKAPDHELARRALATESLPEGWRAWIAERLESGAGE
jgi:MOSC domain-containing protein YiiM